ncbi:MAG: AtpZ/AtpI family protein [Defluviitaleaceae bacterium]|nr:AtpZ/AtpI family protein [Defluviitaleaceae bacterium]
MSKYSKMSKEDKRSFFRAMGYMSQLGLSAVSCVVIGIFIGWFLDGRFGTEPLFIMIFSILGCLSAFKAMYDIAKKF